MTRLTAAMQRVLSTDPETQKLLRKEIDEVIAEARNQVAASFPFDDPRGARHSVRRAVYKKIMGAQINIYNSRRAGRATSYEPPRKPRPQYARGGNRMPRSNRTDTIMHYGPSDRGFILRFLNAGTVQRFAHGRNLSRATYQEHVRNFAVGKAGTYNRGRIAASNWFRQAGEPALRAAADKLANLIESRLAQRATKWL